MRPSMMSKGLPHPSENETLRVSPQQTLCELHAQKVEQRRRCHKKIERPGQWNKSQRGSKSAEGQDRPHRHDEQRADQQRPARPALKWITHGADDVDHERLRGQRLDEPAGLKERLRGSEEMQQDVERQEVED